MAKRKPPSPLLRFNSSPEIIRLVVMMYVKFSLSLRNVEDLLHERGIDICHETVRFWWNRFGPMFAAEIRRKRVEAMRQHTHWRWHLDEVYVKINGETHYLWRAVDQEGEVLESCDPAALAISTRARGGAGHILLPRQVLTQERDWMIAQAQAGAAASLYRVDAGATSSGALKAALAAFPSDWAGSDVTNARTLLSL